MNVQNYSSFTFAKNIQSYNLNLGWKTRFYFFYDMTYLLIQKECILKIGQGPFNNYIRGQDEGGRGKKMSVFVHAQGIKTVQVKKWQNSVYALHISLGMLQASNRQKQCNFNSKDLPNQFIGILPIKFKDYCLSQVLIFKSY